MINQIINSLVYRAKLMGVVLMGVGGFAAYDYHDKTANYIPVQARITDVKEMCFMERRSGRTREWSETTTCAIAELAVKISPKWKGFDVKHQITVAYDYISPVDKRTHSGKRELSDYPNGQKLSSGQIYQIRASKTDPNRSREI